ncbi:transposase [Pseudomonas sp. 008]|uniref:transposase n=1 Tax=Pseudomonas sp. 008 TaxID=2803906 RepID=UPI0023B2E85A|nr:transposase [Pseudomonas sp. 008]
MHAWCLMTNHVHLLISPHEHSSTSSLMKGIGQRYVQYINRTYGRSGTLWEGRFRSCLVQSDSYVLINGDRPRFLGAGQSSFDLNVVCP